MIKIFINFAAYIGFVLGVDQELLGSKLVEVVSLNSATTNIIIGVGIFAWVIKIIWFIYDKFFLERKERLKKLND